jgi:NACHT domain/Sulfatase-modifying factor enzyme 1
MPEEPQKPKEADLLEKIKQKIEETALSWGLPGLLVALAVHFAREQQWNLAILLTVGAGAIALLLRFFDKLSPHLDKLFEWLANNFAGWVQRLWWKLTAQFQGRYYESLIFACRDFRTQGLKTKGPFTLDLEKVFVPLRIVPESPDRVMAGMLQSRGTAEELKIWNFLADLKNQPAFRRIVAIAPPGAGKSTLLEHLALTYAHNTQRRQDRRAPRLIPVLLYLRDVRETISSEQPPDLATLIEQQESIKALNPQGWFKRNLDRGKCLVMLDGLDEVADEIQRKKVSQWVDRQMQLYPKTPFILTSRPFGYRSAPLEQVGTVVEVKPFSLQEMKQFVNNWYLQQEIMSRLGKDDRGVRDSAAKQAEDLIGRIQNTPTLAAMALNPLLLTMIATVHCFRGVLPGRRVELYHEICDVLLGRRQDAKKIPDALTATQKKVVLQVLALGLMKQQTREFTHKLGAQIIQDKLRDIGGYEANAIQYQLFIDEKRTESKYRQPDHWTDRRFRPGDATKPITGVRASDAEEFCQWLTARSTAQYRLLTLAEAEKYPISLQTIGYWCNFQGSKKVMGISQQCWENWSHTFFEILDRNCNRDLDLIVNLDRDRNHNFDLIVNRDCDRNLDLEFDLEFARALDFALDRALNIDLDINRALNRALGHGSTNKGEALTTLLNLTLAWNLLLGTYLKIEEKKDNIWGEKRKNYEELIQKYAQRRDAAYRIYKFCVLVEERQAGKLPAWEGVRIARDRILD